MPPPKHRERRRAQKTSPTADGPGDDCVEVSPHPTHVHVHDSKTPARPHLTLSPGVWSRFVSRL
ncbi:DUF397 domain-containing protein [Streptomyces sp. 6N223]|uniref:DUF397 domain-containing protein n=1 Tax=Streptomyces sp. 6N223 TaxID=3457412 RepID=UPI003FD62966